MGVKRGFESRRSRSLRPLAGPELRRVRVALGAPSIIRLRALLSSASGGRVRERVEPCKHVAFDDAGVPALAAISALPHLAIGEAGE
jgi:hypothetical protein